MLIFIFILSCVLIGLFGILIFAQRLLYWNTLAKNEPKKEPHLLPKVSIVVAAKNEEKNIAGLMKSLQEIDYPSDRIEFIFVDDSSTDNTAKIISEYIPKFKKAYILSAENKVLPGKKGALQIGVEETSSEYIFITDADCQPETYWVKSFVYHFLRGADILFGVAPFKKRKGFINLVSRYEFLRSTLLTFSFATMGFPYSATARSFAFKKEVFTKLNGYYATMDTLGGDDDLFIREAVKSKKNIQPVVEKDTFVWSETKTQLSDYKRQKARHVATSHHYLPIHKLLLGFWHIGNLLSLFLCAFLYLSAWFTVPLGIKLIFDVFITQTHKKRYGVSIAFGHLIWLPFIYEFSLIVNFFASFGEIHWKNESKN